jgi:hypothetical protein
MFIVSQLSIIAMSLVDRSASHVYRLHDAETHPPVLVPANHVKIVARLRRQVEG